jgi:cGMP-dependent protein kinase
LKPSDSSVIRIFCLFDVLDTMTNDQKDAVASVLISQKFSKGQTIVNEGDPASSFYIIKEGTVQVMKGGKEIRKMLKGDSFGEQALYYNTVRQATVRALDNVGRFLKKH